MEHTSEKHQHPRKVPTSCQTMPFLYQLLVPQLHQQRGGWRPDSGQMLLVRHNLPIGRCQPGIHHDLRKSQSTTQPHCNAGTPVPMVSMRPDRRVGVHEGKLRGEVLGHDRVLYTHATTACVAAPPCRDKSAALMQYPWEINNFTKTRRIINMQPVLNFYLPNQLLGVLYVGV